MDVDVLSCQLSIAVFHLYAQYIDDKPLNILEEHNRNRSLFYISNFTYKYPPLEILKDWIFKPFFGHLGTFFTFKKGYNNKEFFGVVAYNKNINTIAIIFRGSQVISEYFYNNFNIAVKLSNKNKTSYNIRNIEIVDGYHNLDYDGALHAGYYNRIETCKDNIFSLIDDIYTFDENNKANLIITGHSLGGASSCIFAGFMSKFKDRYYNIYLRPYGAPMVSTSKYGEWLKNNGFDIKNFVTKSDIIPSFPPIQLVGLDLLTNESIIQKFEPIDKEYFLTSFDLTNYNFLAAHDVRLYYIALCKSKNIDYKILPIFELSNDSKQMKDIFDI